MKAGKFILLVGFLALAFFVSGCGDQTTNPDAKTLTSLTVSPTSATVYVGNRVFFTALAAYSDGSSKFIVPTWSVSSEIGAIVSVGLSGMFTASAEGAGTVTAVYESKTSFAALTVTRSTTADVNRLTTIEVSPATVDMPVNSYQVFSATGLTASGEPVAIAPAWLISGDAIGVFTAVGQMATLEAKAVGTAVISCLSGEVIGQSYVTVEGYLLEITVEADIYVDEGNPTVTYEGETALKAGYLSSTPARYYETYLRFSLAAIPAGLTIESASLLLYATSAGTPALQLYNLGGAFSGTTTWATKPTVSTYLLASAFTAGQYNELSSDPLLAAVRTWYSAPAVNFGFALRQDGGENGVVGMLSKENPTNKPTLSLVYK